MASATSTVQLAQCVPVLAPGGPHPALMRRAQVEPLAQAKVKGAVKVPWRFPSFTRQEIERAHL